MTEWLKVSTGDITPPRSETVRGVELEVMVSPFKRPVEVKGEYDGKLAKFVIYFRYLDNSEPTQLQRLTRDVSIDHGVTSGRIFKIFIDVERLQARAISLKLQVTELAQLLEQSLSGDDQVKGRHDSNRDVVRGILAGKLDRLVPESYINAA